MREWLAWIQLLFGGALLLMQVISSINFPLAQRLGIQEDPAQTDPLLQRSERYTAYWDLFTLPWLPLGGVLMLAGQPYWPLVSLIGGAIYFDIAGREAAKNLSLRRGGVRTGSAAQQKLFFASYVVMGLLGVVAAAFAAGHLL